MASNPEFIGLDLGKAKTGVARASTVAKLAEALESVETVKLVDYLNKLEEVEAVVIGLPRNLEGDDTDQTRWVRDFVKKLKSDIKIPMFWQDEALTSVISAKHRTTGDDDHALAAQIILQDFIDTPVAERVRC